MHYYKFNIGDYRKDTVHLSPIEHYIYRSLIDTYYLDEKPIITQTVMRRLRLSCENKPELDNVLNDFFVERENGWHHVRIDEEIELYHAKAEKNKVNGSKGGRPKKTQSVMVGLKNKPIHNPNHKPLTINQEPLEKEKKKKKAVAFSRPSEKDINNFALDNKLNLDGMFDYYESNGWKVGKNAMKNWQATARNWNRRNNNGTQNKQRVSGQPDNAATRMHERNKRAYAQAIAEEDAQSMGDQDIQQATSNLLTQMDGKHRHR